MIRLVEWSAAAQQDVSSIVDYISRDNPRAAQRVRDRLDDVSKELADMPFGRKGRVAGTYEFPIPKLPYIMTYRLRQDTQGQEYLVVVRVIHGARNWPEGEWPE